MTLIFIAATLFTLLSLYIFFFPSIHYLLNQHYELAFISLLFFLMTVFQLVKERKTLYSKKTHAHQHRLILAFLVLLSSALGTYGFTHFLGINNILASSIIGLFFAFLMGPYSVLGFTGSFIGMSSQGILGFHGLMLACLLTFLLWLFSELLFTGIGGKLGTMAFVGTFSTAIFLPNTFSKINHDLFFDFHFHLNHHTLLIIIISCFLAWLTSWLSHEIYKSNAIKGSSSVGLIIGILSSLTELYSPYPIAAIFYGATFAGMSSIHHFNLKRFWVALSGGLTAVVLLLTLPYWNGLGGKLGLSAFLSVLITKFFFYLWHFLKGGFSND